MQNYLGQNIIILLYNTKNTNGELSWHKQVHLQRLECRVAWCYKCSMKFEYNNVYNYS